MNKINILSLLTLMSVGVSAQSIPNPDIELYTTCPTQQSRFAGNVQSWVSSLGAMAGTPDYYNSCGVFNLSSYPTPILPQSGVGFAGIYAEFNSTFTDYKEYFTAQFSTPLVSGTTYSFSFYTNHLYGAAPTSFTPAGVNLTDLPAAEQGYLGLVFSAAVPAATNTGNGGGGNPRYNSIRNDFGIGRALIPNTNTDVYGAVSRNNWVKVTLSYTSVGGEQYMTVGQFRPGGTSLAASNGAYYLFDNFSVSTCKAGNTAPVLQ
ncbi:hypothetical protein OF897_15105 [Chryseobacterium formosus]|uniref:Uncharacterized protein n=1 Tax=Chryseobacterium formosus TaxID=1537363 RepID=A0ABT3XUC2_9FLAO|nr:hypothetical protein [Chryseobacterium formosus]MCX8525247.1 hypothetical protein [Chryseobacterium formosus]